MAKKKKKSKKDTVSAVSVTDKPKDNYSIAVELLPILREKLEMAKAGNDPVKASMLRKQVWVATDYFHKVTPDLPEDELWEIIKDLPFTLPNQTRVEKVEKLEQPNINSTENRLKNLNRRLEKIEKIKKKVAAKEPVEKNQLESLEKEEEIRKEIQEIQDIIDSV